MGFLHQVTLHQAKPFFADNKYILQHGETVAIARRRPHLLDQGATAIVLPSAQLKHRDNMFITSSLSTVNKDAIGYVMISFSELLHTITRKTQLAAFKVLTPEKMKRNQPVDPAMSSFMI